MNIQPSKLSDAASQVWKESASLFQNKNNVKIDLGLDKTLNKSSNLNENKPILAAGYIFGTNLSERTGFTSQKDSSVELSTTTDVSSIFKRVAQQKPSVNLWKSTSADPDENSSNSDRLKASIDELTKQSQKCSTELSTAEPITTGEENEHNLANISCKFFFFSTETKTWVERGMGTFRINQNKAVKDDIRLVGRSTGSQRVVINSKIFPCMVLEQLSEKRLKISAQNPDMDLPQLFIIHASPASIATVQPLLKRYVARAAKTSSSTSLSPTTPAAPMNEPKNRKRKSEKNSANGSGAGDVVIAAKTSKDDDNNDNDNNSIDSDEKDEIDNNEESEAEDEEKPAKRSALNGDS